MDKHKKVAVVTGANSGVGFEVTKGLLKNGYHVVMACRSPEKANDAKAKLQASVASSSVEVMTVDMSELESVKAFAQQFQSKFKRLDLLVNNAGILLNKPKRSSADVELQFATNHLGHFLLTSLLIGMMPDTAESRVVSLSSVAHKKAQIHFDDINCEAQTKWDAPYAQSKLACLMFADELHRRLNVAGKKVVSVSAHPGGTDSGLFQSMSPILMGILRYTFVPVFLHSTESAARPVLMAALDGEVQGGEYFGPTGLFEMKGPPGVAKRSEYAQKEDVAARLWDVSEQLTGARFEVAAS